MVCPGFAPTAQNTSRARVDLPYSGCPHAVVVSAGTLPTNTQIETKLAERPRIARQATRWAFWFWACLSFVMATLLMVAHTYALPKPATSDPELRAAVAATRNVADGRRFRALHVLYSRCRCSQRILSHLSERGAMASVSERVVLVGENADYERAARAAGFQVDVITPEQLVARYGVTAAPLFLVAGPDDELRYVGGYSERKQGLDLRDVAILKALVAGESSTELPLFGCAVSDSLKKLLDPLGLKDSSEGDR
jgi:hypothetical protein